MIDIGLTDFLINVPSIPQDDFERYSTNLFDEWERSVEQHLILPDYAISLEVEEGSIKGLGKIGVVLGTLYFGIGEYGDFISGLQTIRSQVSYVSNALFESARSPFGCSNANAKVKRSGGSLSQLHRLFDKVQKGAMSPDEAIIEVERIFGEEAVNLPGFMSDLRSEFEKAPRYPEQLSLTDETWEECNILPPPKKRSPTSSRPKPIPPSQQYRIEIWRESKKEKKNVKVTKLKEK